MAYKLGLERAGPVILEPVMSVEVASPEEYLGALIADLLGRTGRVEEIEDRPGGKLLRALVPLRQLFGYTTRLRSLAQGRAAHTMQLHSYQAGAQGGPGGHSAEGPRDLCWKLKFVIRLGKTGGSYG